jgi:hypothetical protein
VKRITTFVFGIVLVCASAVADEPPPRGFDFVASSASPAGGFKLALYTKPPGDFTCESQIWLEPIKPQFRRQLLFTFTNRARALIDSTDSYIAIAHHEDSADNFLWLFVRREDGLFHRVPQELRAAALKEFCQQTHIQKSRDDFFHFDCYPEAWLPDGQIQAHIQGDSNDKSFYLKPWHFIYDAERERFVSHDFPENKDAFVREQR